MPKAMCAQPFRGIKIVSISEQAKVLIPRKRKIELDNSNDRSVIRRAEESPHENDKWLGMQKKGTL